MPFEVVFDLTYRIHKKLFLAIFLFKIPYIGKEFKPHSIAFLG